VYDLSCALQAYARQRNYRLSEQQPVCKPAISVVRTAVDSVVMRQSLCPQQNLLPLTRKFANSHVASHPQQQCNSKQDVT